MSVSFLACSHLGAIFISPLQSLKIFIFTAGCNCTIGVCPLGCSSNNLNMSYYARRGGDRGSGRIQGSGGRGGYAMRGRSGLPPRGPLGVSSRPSARTIAKARPKLSLCYLFMVRFLNKVENWMRRASVCFRYMEGAGITVMLSLMWPPLVRASLHYLEAWRGRHNFGICLTRNHAGRA